MTNRLYETIGDLIEKEEDPAEYCFDEAGLLNEHIDGYSECDEKGDERGIAIACMAIEQKVSYSSAEKGVQKSLYEALVSTSREKHKRYRGCMQSKDRMTNFGYVLKILIGVLDKIDEEDIRELAWKSYGSRTFPQYGVFFKEGFAGERGISGRLKQAPRLEKTFAEFAKNGSAIGNYTNLPTGLPGLGIRGLNNMKGGVGTSLFVHDKEKTPYRVNDQFALFSEWVGTYEEIAEEEDRDIIRAWKAMMLLDEADESGKTAWKLYLEAAEQYKAIFQRVEPAERLEAFTRYLDLVNAAIKFRSTRIVKKIQDANPRSERAGEQTWIRARGRGESPPCR